MHNEEERNAILFVFAPAATIFVFCALLTSGPARERIGHGLLLAMGWVMLAFLIGAVLLPDSDD